MKRLLIIALMVFLTIPLSAQVFNSGANLNGKVFNIGIQPVLSGFGTINNPAVFTHMDLKIIPFMNFTAKVGIGDYQYYGAAIKWSLLKFIALSGGAHYDNNIGFDGSLIFSIPLGSGNYLFTGIDADMEYVNRKVVTPLWMPLGLSVSVTPVFSVAIEGDIAISSDAGHIFGGGIILFF
jgi:hypothetical protein